VGGTGSLFRQAGCLGNSRSRLTGAGSGRRRDDGGVRIFWPGFQEEKEEDTRRAHAWMLLGGVRDEMGMSTHVVAG
jgi:hypothetical protein